MGLGPFRRIISWRRPGPILPGIAAVASIRLISALLSQTSTRSQQWQCGRLSVTAATNRRNTMADTKQYNFVMTIPGEDAFEVLRFGFDRAGFHARSIWEAESDSLHQPRSNLQILCSVIEAQKTMLFTRMSDLTTIRLVETFL